ncbi:hypothetical protein LLH23_17600 [bacterium]|nr:hypothetical protein [bacterium]
MPGDDAAEQARAVVNPTIAPKVRDRVEVPADTDMTQVQEQALALPNVVKHMEGKAVVKVVVVAGRLVNVVVK